MIMIIIIIIIILFIIMRFIKCPFKNLQAHIKTDMAICNILIIKVVFITARRPLGIN